MTKIHELQEDWVVDHDKFTNQAHSRSNYSKINVTLRGRLAMAMVERWGMVAADVGGEDSQGRQRWVPMDPEDLVRRAVDTADLLVNELHTRGWLEPMPAPSLKEE